MATVLTGMGQDGLRGAEEIKRAGGYLIAQDEASSVVWGMPGAIVHAGFADEVLDLGSIANAILKKTGN
jgi:two-component system chemotaxis response regulator CheB